MIETAGIRKWLLLQKETRYSHCFFLQWDLETCQFAILLILWHQKGACKSNMHNLFNVSEIGIRIKFKLTKFPVRTRAPDQFQSPWMKITKSKFIRAE